MRGSCGIVQQSLKRPVLPEGMGVPVAGKDSPVGAAAATKAGFDLVAFHLAFHVAQELLPT